MTNETTRPLLSVSDLTIAFSRNPDRPATVKGLSFDLNAGETLAIVGESGSGKSVSVMSLLRLLPPNTAVIRKGRAAMDDGTDLLSLSEEAMNDVRGAKISMIFQEPMTSLNPVLTIGLQLTEILTVHQKLDGGAARAAAIAMLEKVRISDPERRMRQYPHELSGGMRQRVMIAMALACRPRILIADEPTTALDVTIQAEILNLLRDLKREMNTSIILITHDMGVVAEMADRVIVMRGGEKLEEADVDTLFAKPSHPYTKALLAAVPRLGETAAIPGPVRFRLPGMPESEIDVPAVGQPSGAAGQSLLDVQDLHVRFDVREGFLRRVVGRVHAVDGVSFTIHPGETLALVGESGCGKSTTGRALMRLEQPTDGKIFMDGYDVTRLGQREMRPVRRLMQMIFQDPFASLNPRLEAGSQVEEPLAIHGIGDSRSRSAASADLFRKVGLDVSMRNRFPHEFSGGQRQRLCIARALALNPKLIIADEAVSALDVSVQAQVVNLMLDLQAELGISYLFISHDMAVVERVAHRIAVMRAGRIVEIGPKTAVLSNPRHSYTRRLLAAVPVADPVASRARPVLDRMDMPSPIRHRDAQFAYPALTDLGGGHFVLSEH